MTNHAAAHNQSFQNFILFEQFQIALPLDWIGIILGGTGIAPVDAGQYPKKVIAAVSSFMDRKGKR